MSIRTAHFRFLPTFACLAAACAGGDASTGTWAGTIDTVGTHTLVVHSPATPVWDSTTAWRAERTLRIESADGDGPDAFGRVGDAEMDDDGNVYIMESQSSEIRVFDAAGAHVRTIGHEGSGPGELRSPLGIAWAGRDSLLVVDPRNARYTIYGAGGAYVGEYRRPLGSSSVPWPGGVDAEGDIYDYAFSMRPGQTARRALVRIARAADATAPLDTIPIPDPPDPEERFELRTGDGFITANIPFSSAFTWTFDPRGYVWFASTGRYRIFQTDLRGDTIRIVERDFEPVPVTSEERQAAIDGFDWFVRQGGHIDASKIPARKAPLQSFIADDAGNLWVRLAPRGRDGPARWDIFDPDGRYLGTMDGLPARVLRIRDGRVLGIASDELDVPYVEVYTLRKPCIAVRPTGCHDSSGKR